MNEIYKHLVFKTTFKPTKNKLEYAHTLLDPETVY